MSTLKFTKQYSATDDGSKVSGADLGTLETDIAAILNGGITNVNLSASAGVVESKITFDTAAGHDHDGSNSRALSAGGQRGFIQGAWLNYVAADQVKADSGVIEIGGSFYTRNSYSTTIDTDTAAHWVEGASQRAINTWAYVYAYNDSGSTYDIKYWLQQPQYADTGTDDSSVKIYRQNASVWYRCLGAVRMDAVGSGNILKFYQHNNYVSYDEAISCSTATFAGWTDDVSVSIAIPSISQLGLFGNYHQGNAVQAGCDLRPAGGAQINTNFGSYTYNSGAITIAGGNEILCYTSSTQTIDVYNQPGVTFNIVYVLGYFLNIR